MQSITFSGRRTSLLRSARTLASGAALAMPWPVAVLGSPSRNPFTLGVASGAPTDRGMTLWTRLAPDPARADGGLTASPVTVRWSIASEPSMRRIVASGEALARADSVHSVHVDVTGLSADRFYWYRFEALGALSPIGRTRTLATAGQPLGEHSPPVRIAVASCQNIEHGWYAAHRHIASDAPDFIVHVGDYIYEGTWGRDLVRPHHRPTAHTLADYRALYTLYRRDPDLQAAHAVAPWWLIQDDHEVANDYAGLQAERVDDQPGFAARRAAAWRAWYEHMPVPARLAPREQQLPQAEVVRFGDLFSLYLLDTRQYRAPQACPPAGRKGGHLVDPSRCPDLYDPTRSLLGAAQEQRLERAFEQAATRWNLIAQQTLVAPLRHPASDGRPDRVRTDGWDGYPAARARLLDAIQGRRLNNPVVLGGDLHAHYAADLRSGPAGRGPVVASEFVGTSISSQAGSADYYARLLKANEDLRFADGSRRGYLRLAIGRGQLTVDMQGLLDVRRADSAVLTQASWVVEAGRARARRAG